MSTVDEKRWAMAVGRFMLAFGNIEWSTYVCLVHLPTEPLFQSASSLGFTQRAELLRGLLSAPRFSASDGPQLRQALKKAIGLNRIRNVIAHNPVMMNLYDTPRGIDFRPEITPFRNPKKKLTIAGLENLAKQAETLAGQIHNHQTQVFHDCT